MNSRAPVGPFARFVVVNDVSRPVRTRPRGGTSDAVENPEVPMTVLEPNDISEEQTEKTPVTPAQPSSSYADQEVVDFLDRFATALTAGDTAAIVGLWETPGIIVFADGVKPMNSADDIEKMFGNAKEMYAKYGISDTRADVTHLQWIGERIAHVEVRFPWLDASGDEVGGESSTYTLRRDDDGQLKLRVVIMHGVEKGTPQ
jgi:hypothetical protein